jgi:hypothetical protein
MASVIVPAVALVIFLAVLAGLLIHARITRRQDRQYVLVNGIPVGLSGAVCRLNGLGSRDLDPALLGGTARRG